MIKIRIHLDGNKQGVLTYTCKESLEDYYGCIKHAVDVVALTEIDTEAIITIPFNKYVIEAWAIDD